MQYIIIGAGPAGVIAAETLRKTEPGCGIKLIGDEPEPPYSRMALPYYLNDKIDEAGTFLRKSDGYFQSNDIEIIQDRVTSLDTVKHCLQLEGMGEMNFDRLLIATGAHPVTPHVPGIDQEGIFTCWTLADARNIASRAKSGSQVVLIGAGFIGCIILEALVSRGVKLTVVEMEDRMVPRMMNQTAGGMIRDWCQSNGLNILTSSKLDAIEKNNGQLQLQLENESSLKADTVIIATGVRSNTGFLDGSNIEVDEGILVNEFLQSSIPEIYAAGDVCQGMDFSTGQYSVQAIQPTAADQGRLAALNMCGRQIRHQGCINMNVLDTLGLVSASFGLWEGIEGGESVELLDTERFHYLNLQFQEDTLIGAQSLGLTQHVGVIRGLIQTQLRLGKWKDRLLADPTRIMEAYLGTTQPIGYNSGIIQVT